MPKSQTPIQDGGLPVQNGGLPVQNGGLPVQKWRTSGDVDSRWRLPVPKSHTPIQDGGLPVRRIQDGGGREI